MALSVSALRMRSSPSSAGHTHPPQPLVFYPLCRRELAPRVGRKPHSLLQPRRWKDLLTMAMGCSWWIACFARDHQDWWSIRKWRRRP
ncbi:hypothetical protein HNY73_015474 [Argiope bruennichi]|uniref:Uncharacterized protein n=1 Tax=Argiope bruennichi TaxID=94029 RepID=A0A8T0ES56_ARGBR|nr:hypothetical protein HNY73_015474 [Argiope bruennichi]